MAIVKQASGMSQAGGLAAISRGLRNPPRRVTTPPGPWHERGADPGRGRSQRRKVFCGIVRSASRGFGEALLNDGLQAFKFLIAELRELGKLAFSQGKSAPVLQT